MSFGLFWPPILLHTRYIKALFSWICWFDSWKFHFYKNWKAQIILFGYKTYHKNSYPICFMTGDMYIVNAFICYFWFVAFLLSQKLKNVKYSFWLQKEVKIHIRFVFFDPQSPNLVWFHLLFLIHCHFVTPKLEKRKIPFLVTKRNQKLKMINFSDEQFPECA